MKTIQVLIPLFFCLLIFSCSDGDNKIEPINGTWHTFERTVNLSSDTKSSDAGYLQERINIYYAGELNDYDITKYYNGELLKVVTTLKTDPSKPVSESESSYRIEGDTITINDRIYGAEKYKYVITNKILTLYGALNLKRIADIADQLGIMIPIPQDIKGTIKIKDYR
ncbi:MAG: hypothetical protein LBL79_01545 [Prevotella sp.]|jgi:hypothetical protein|nr:hypothetical protein [Prevotella sp.]